MEFNRRPACLLEENKNRFGLVHIMCVDALHLSSSYRLHSPLLSSVSLHLVTRLTVLLMSPDLTRCDLSHVPSVWRLSVFGAVPSLTHTDGRTTRLTESRVSAPMSRLTKRAQETERGAVFLTDVCSCHITVSIGQVSISAMLLAAWTGPLMRGFSVLNAAPCRVYHCSFSLVVPPFFFEIVFGSMHYLFLNWRPD